MEEDTPSPHRLRDGDHEPRLPLTSTGTPHLRDPKAAAAADVPLTQAILRLLQCPRCSRPLHTPLRLPCGNTMCRACLPPRHPRTGVTYPNQEERKEGFMCSTCLHEHCLGDCGTDVLLTRLVEVFDEGAYEGKTYEGDGELFGQVKERLRGELDCHVCYSLILDPLTTCCGHTFCRGCVALVLAHSDLCPVCRRRLNLSATTLPSEPVNRRVASLMEALFPEQVAARREASALEASSGVGDNPTETTLPLFVSSLSLPTMPTFLHIFEPRYRLMIRRVMQTRGRRFGMVMFNRAGRLQGGLGRSPFLQYGTVLVVDRYELLPDGRSLVVATGVSRFKVLRSEVVDGYHVGRVQRVDDVSVTEEEARETLETAGTPAVEAEGGGGLAERPLDRMSTQELFQLGLEFARRQHGQGAVWLRPRALLAYGDIPTDPARFPWWFASVLPVWEEEKYALLAATSVRERLKITARWVRKLESRQWPDRARPAIASVL
ncbi:PUA-like domain-containing protein [Aspergillus ambiguus]|uniref:putative ATP-dependent protease (CrgA) n=1 Tax=Aspergillus ambiguus TaxID=176160 RepID=UPI003CCDBC65